LARRAKTESEYREVGRARGIDWAGRVLPNNVLEHTEWHCHNGHLFLARYNDLQQGRGCPYCSGRAHRKRTDYDEIGRRKGYTLIGDMPATTRQKTKWRGKDGKIVLASYQNMSERIDARTGHPGSNAYDRHKLDPESTRVL
jgi:hypothetical protein